MDKNITLTSEETRAIQDSINDTLNDETNNPINDEIKVVNVPVADNIYYLNGNKFEVNKSMNINSRIGIYLITEKLVKKEIVKEITRICNYFKPIKYITDYLNGFKIEAEFTNDIGELKTAKILLSDLHSRTKVINSLCFFGFSLLPQSVHDFITYANGMLAKTPPCDAVHKTGWYICNNHHTYILPSDYRIYDKKYGDEMRGVSYEGNIIIDKEEIKKGTLREWQDNIAKHCTTDYAIFGLLFGFSAVFGSTTKNGFMVHYYTNSSKSKSSLSAAIGSIFGEKICRASWHSTPNGIPSFVEERNDMIIVLDESHRYGETDNYGVNRHSFDEMAYNICNPETKVRMATSNSAMIKFSARGMNQKFPHIFSNGEYGVKLTATGGKQLRIINMEVNQPFANDMIANNVRENSCNYYGTAGIAFIQYIIDNKIDILDSYHNYINLIKKSYQNIYNNEQVRMMGYFAEILLAGRILYESGIFKVNNYEEIILKIYNHYIYRLFRLPPAHLSALTILHRAVVNGDAFPAEDKAIYKVAFGYRTAIGNYTLRLRAFHQHLTDSGILIKSTEFQDLLVREGILDMKIRNTIQCNTVYHLEVEKLNDLMDEIEKIRAPI